MAVASETASASDAGELFGGRDLDLGLTQFGDDVLSAAANPGVTSQFFGHDLLDSLDFSRAVDSCFKPWTRNQFCCPGKRKHGDPFCSLASTTWMTSTWAAFFVQPCRDLVLRSQFTRRSDFHHQLCCLPIFHVQL